MDVVSQFVVLRNKRKVCLHQGGQGLVEYILLLGLLALVIVAGLALTGGGIGEAIGNITKPMTGDEVVANTPVPGEEQQTFDITVKPVDAEGNGIADVSVHAFNGQGDFLNLTKTTGQDGAATFTNVDPGSYAFRADVQMHEFWSEIVAVPGKTYVEIPTGARPVTLRVTDSRGTGLASVPIHVFTADERYVNLSAETDANGNASVVLVDGSFKFRADYQGQPFWSEVFTTPETTEAVVVVNQAPFTVQVVTQKGEPVADVPVYAFNANEGYTGFNGRTDSNGSVTLQLPDGTYKFRADYQGVDYWSDEVTTPQASQVTIKIGIPPVTVRVKTEEGGVPNIYVYACYENNRYAGKYARTDGSGTATFDLPAGKYKFMAYYMGYQYWSKPIKVPKESSVEIEISSDGVKIKVEGKKGKPVVNALVIVYRYNNGSLAYTGRYGYTDREGEVKVTLPEGQFRAFVYLGYADTKFKKLWAWSDTFHVPKDDEVKVKVKD